MDIGLIFRTKEPLSRLHFFVGVSVVCLVCIPLYIVGGIWSNFSAAMFLLWFCSIIFFILRRLIDIGFKSFITAGLGLLAFALVGYFLSNITPLAPRLLGFAYWGFLLLTPTGWAIKKAEVPPKKSW